MAMPDPKFYHRAAPFSLQELADVAGAAMAEGVNSALVIEDVAPLDKAGANEISFFDNRKYLDQFLATKAGAVLVHPDFLSQVPKGTAALITETPYLAYAKIAQAFYPLNKARGAPEISARAHIALGAVIGENCTVEAGAVISKGAEIGAGCHIKANAVIGENVVLGKYCTVGHNASIRYALIGNHVVISEGARIGSDGFGFAMSKTGHVAIPQLGRVIIGDRARIGANTTIDRGSGPDTEIGMGAQIDNLVQLGHNVKIGAHAVIVAQVGISGSTEIGMGAVLGGQVGVAGHLKIGDGAQLSAQSGVMRDVPSGAKLMGSPAIPIKECFRQLTAVKKLVKKGTS